MLPIIYAFFSITLLVPCSLMVTELHRGALLNPSMSSPNQPPPIVDDKSLNQDSSSPFYIHPSEGPSTVVISPLLMGNNYHSWSRSFRMALVSKNKMTFISGSIPDPSYFHWERCNNLILSWLLNSVSQSITQSIIYFDHAVNVWNDLKDRFSQGDLLRIAEL